MDQLICVFVCVFFPFILDVRLVDVPAGVTQEEGHTGFLIRLPSAVLASIFLSPSISMKWCTVVTTLLALIPIKTSRS